MHTRKQWLKKGDGNTKFFHATANRRRCENTIGSMEDKCKIFYREEDKRDYFYSCCNVLFAQGSVIGCPQVIRPC